MNESSLAERMKNILSGLSEKDLESILTLAPARPKERIEGQKIDFSKCFAVGIYFGIQPDIDVAMFHKTYRKYVLVNMMVHYEIGSAFQEQGIGFEVESDHHSICMMGVFPHRLEHGFVERYIRPLVKRVETLLDVKLCVGVGLAATSPKQLKNAYETAHYAFNLYFFEKKAILELQKINRCFTLTLDDYYRYVDDALKSILIKAPDTMEKIDQVVDVICSIHYGNYQAVLMRTMNYTGELSSKLWRYHLLEGDFFAMQNRLQEKVLSCVTMSEMKQCIHDHYANLLEQIYSTRHPQHKVMTERIKSYIQENFMNNLSMKTLAEIACVSTNYFSHMFKKETGVNYKTYLTDIRLENALVLLMESDCQLDEICEKVGYKNVRTFVDAFKQKYGKSPMNYKKSMTNTPDPK